jgi:hypothetical protein
MSNPSKSCGPHSTIVSNDRLRITQCPCGAYHVALNQRGVSVQMSLDEVKALSEGCGVALRVADAEARGAMLASCTGTVN